MQGDVISIAGHIFMVKGNDVEVLGARPLLQFDPDVSTIAGGKYESPTHQKIKELLDEGYELAVDDGSEKSKAMKSIIKNSNVLSNSMFNPSLGSDLNSKILRNIKLLGSGLGKVLPSIAGFSSIPSIPGAIASGLLYAGTSKPLNAGEMDYFNPPFEPSYRETGSLPRISESFDRDPVVFDRYMQDKIQNQRNNQGIMGVNANRERTSSRVDPQGNIRAYGLKRGGIVSL